MFAKVACLGFTSSNSALSLLAIARERGPLNRTMAMAPRPIGVEHLKVRRRELEAAGVSFERRVPNRETVAIGGALASCEAVVVTGALPVFETNWDRNTKKSLIFPTVPSTSARSPASPAV